jgi:predicted transposase/invertase (TIGR01784 family)
LADAREKAWRDEKAYLDEARLEGKLEAKLEGKLEEKRSIALNLIRYDMPVAVVSEMTGLSVVEVSEIAAAIEKP